MKLKRCSGCKELVEKVKKYYNSQLCDECFKEAQRRLPYKGG